MTQALTKALVDDSIEKCTEILVNASDKEVLDKGFPRVVAKVLNKFFSHRNKDNSSHTALEALLEALGDVFENGGTEASLDATLDVFSHSKEFFLSIFSIVCNFEVNMRDSNKVGDNLSPANHKCYELTLFLLLGK